MTPHWMAVLACIAAVVTMAYTAAVPTQDTLVVARSEDGSTSPASITTEAESTTEPSLPIKLTEMEVHSEVSLRYSHSRVVAYVRNPAKRAQEANFRVLLPETAFISGFVMTLDGKSYKAYVKEKEEAKQIYQQAVSQGVGAAHIATKARDSNQFTVSVNVEANSSAVFNLTYEELLVRRNGVYNHDINLHPGALVPKLTVTVHIKESQKITDLRVPEIRTGNEIDATQEDAVNTQAVIERSKDGREATITFKPDLEEQKRLIAIYAEKTKSSAEVKPWNGIDEAEEKDIDGVLGQFVVQYDVDRPKSGEILVNDGYFVHFFAPEDLPPLSKHVVFVLDTSGSMMDRKIVQLREAMQTILSDLSPNDYFSIVEFESSVEVHDLKEADAEPLPAYNRYKLYESEPTLVPPALATPENIAKAKIIVSRLQASGGTNIYSALKVAIKLIQMGVEWTPASNATALPAASSASLAATTTSTTATDVERESEGRSLSTPKQPEKEGKTLEPIIIFLTDGDPTVGETDRNVIINHATEQNSGDNKATIFTLAFGEDADRKFLRKLSLRNAGFMRHIYEAADAALQLHHFYKQVASPLLAHVQFVYPPEQVKADSVTKNKFRTFYSGSEVVVAGQVVSDEGPLTPLVSAFCGVDDKHNYGRKRYETRPVTPAPRAGDYLPLERLWAYLTIQQLLDQRDARDATPTTSDKDDSPDKKALALAIKYEFVTPLTSLVVVKPNATNAVNAESVDKQTDSSVPYYNSQVLAARPLSFGSSIAYSSQGGLAGIPAPALLSIGNSGYPAPQFAADLDSLLEAEAEETDYDSLGFAQVKRVTLRGGSIANNWPSAYFASRTGNTYHHAQTHGGPYFAADTYRHDLIVKAYTRPPIVVTTPFKPSILLKYQLTQYSWLEPLVDDNTNSLVMQVNGTTISLKLSEDSSAPKSAAGDAKCAHAVGGGAGACVYLSRCAPAALLTADLYSDLYCSVDGYAGVCCDQDKIDTPTTN